MMDVAVIDAGGANLGSVRFALERLGATPRIVHDAEALRDADRVILPGVGAAAPAMSALRERGLDVALRTSEAPILGICLGMQLLFERSEEGGVACLGLLSGEVRRMRPVPGMRVPHMGWNRLRSGLQLRCDTALLDGIQDGAWAYFAHSYAVPIGDACIVECTHGDSFAAVVQQGRISGTQFHPERSAEAGARLLDNFLRSPA